MSSFRPQPGQTIWDVVDEYYQEKYDCVHSSGALGGANASFHRALESRRADQYFPVVLELGAGNLQHFRFVEHSFERYVATDLRPPRDVPHEIRSDPRVQFEIADACSLPYPDSSFDRVVATCLIMHLVDPFQAVLEWQRVCKYEGVIDFLVPCDPGIAVRIFRRLVSHRAASRQGVSAELYRFVNSAEHVSSFTRVRDMAAAAVAPNRRLRIRYFPFRLGSWNINGFAVFTITAPQTAR